MTYDPPLDQSEHLAIVTRPWGIRGMGRYWMSPRYNDQEAIASILGFVKRRQRSYVYFLLVGLCAAITSIVWYIFGNNGLGLWLLLGTIIIGLLALVHRFTEKSVDMCPLPSHYAYIILLLDRLAVKVDRGEAQESDVILSHSQVLQLCQRRRKVKHVDMDRVEQSIHDMLNTMVKRLPPEPDPAPEQKDGADERQ